jgi:hypothetical protein
MPRFARAIHVVERGRNHENLVRVRGRPGIWESGYWVVSDTTAAQLIGGKIYVHRDQRAPAHSGGTILEAFDRPGSNVSRKVFVFRAEKILMGSASPASGWGNEKCVEWEEFVKPGIPVLKQDEESAFPEGKKKFRQHFERERDSALTRKAKAIQLQKTGKLECEVCLFDFAKKFGPHGEGFIEVHHKVPVAKLDGTTKTRLTDLALVCSNCHRMLHRGKPLPTIEKLQTLRKRGV